MKVIRRMAHLLLLLFMEAPSSAGARRSALHLTADLVPAEDSNLGVCRSGWVVQLVR
jgi:hypothetical protein